ncbi:Hypothetical predicted protein, partial [Mytilus galloprovincialis]
GKIYCHVLNARLSSWLDDNNGFREKRSCEEHIIINDRKIARLSTFVCFVDMRKAFDTVQRNLLWYKLSNAGIRGKFQHHTP